MKKRRTSTVNSSIFHRKSELKMPKDEMPNSKIFTWRTIAGFFYGFLFLSHIDAFAVTDQEFVNGIYSQGRSIVELFEDQNGNELMELYLRSELMLPYSAKILKLITSNGQYQKEAKIEDHCFWTQSSLNEDYRYMVKSIVKKSMERYNQCKNAGIEPEFGSQEKIESCCAIQ